MLIKKDLYLILNQPYMVMMVIFTLKICIGEKALLIFLIHHSKCIAILNLLNFNQNDKSIDNQHYVHIELFY